MTVKAYFDFACPWCYIAKVRFERVLASFVHRAKVCVEWKSFELLPDMTATCPCDLTAYLAKTKRIPVLHVNSVLDRCAAMAAGEGVEIDFSRVRLFNSRKAHELFCFAKAHGRGRVMMNRLFYANFSEGRELGLIEVLVELAGDVGLDPAAVENCLESGHFSDAVLADQNEAKSFQVQSLPHFVLGGTHVLTGVQDSALFSRTLDAAWAARTQRCLGRLQTS